MFVFYRVFKFCLIDSFKFQVNTAQNKFIGNFRSKELTLGQTLNKKKYRIAI
jgi:hypothetical protein